MSVLGLFKSTKGLLLGASVGLDGVTKEGVLVNSPEGSLIGLVDDYCLLKVLVLQLDHQMVLGWVHFGSSVGLRESLVGWFLYKI